MELQRQEVILRKLIPSGTNHIATKDKREMYEGVIYLGMYDTEDNYIEVSDEEYQEWLKQDSENANQ